MDQKDLRSLEYRCIQEEPPRCQAACPLHIDVRAFIAAIRRKDWAAGGATLRKRMPLAGVLGRICDAPCTLRCKRGEVDDPICIGELERACVGRAGAGPRPQVLPSRGRSVAVLGGGLAGMTAAWDLVRKGCRVSVYSPGGDPRGLLRRLDPLRLDPEAVAAEIAALTDLGVVIAPRLPPGGGDEVARCRAAHDAVVVDLAAWPDPAGVLPRDAGGRVAADPVSRAAGPQGVFAGGDTDSFVGQAADGRRAAASADRWLQGVSLTAGREKDGPYETRLFTSTRGVRRQPAVPPADPAAGRSEAEALAEAGRCLLCECKECVKVCPYLEHFGAYPRKYAREIYNNAIFSRN